MNGSDDRVLSARWIFPADSAPLSRGTITITGDRITAIHPFGERTPDKTFDQAVIIPGLVNAHTHLDLSHLRNAVPPRLPLTDWLQEIVAQRRSHPPEQANQSINNGLSESLKFGTTLLGDIAGNGLSWQALQAAPIWSVCYREILGLSAARAETAWQEAIAWLEKTPETLHTRAGLSPHAPYSVSRAIIQAAARVAPVSVHLAETSSEQELLEQQTGEFVPFLKALGVWEANALAPNWDWITWRCGRAPHALLAHGNYLPPSTAIASQSTLVYCPRTHTAFGHSPYPLETFLKAGHRVALGTDSLASSPDLDILAEARHAKQQHPNLSSETLLQMATQHGAHAMEMGTVTGSLTPGKSADLVVVPVSANEPNDPHDLLWVESLPHENRRTMWQGKWRE